MIWVQTLTAVALVSAMSLVGALTLSFKPDTLKRGLLVLIAFAAGGLLGDAFLHLIPEIAESEPGLDLAASGWILAGLVGFFLLEKALHWHHAHLPTADVLHPVAITNLVGDGLHNLIDGALIAGAFLASPSLGVATTLAVVVHEIPQEMGDFGILVHAGLKPRRALLLNLASGMAALVGAVLTLAVAEAGLGVERALLAFTAGGFIYIASTDLIPELHREPETGKSLVQLGGLLSGIAVMAALLMLE